VNAGLRNFDAISPVLIPVKKTRLVGMAADLAALVRDRPLISNTVMRSAQPGLQSAAVARSLQLND